MAHTKGVPTKMDLQRQFIDIKDSAIASTLVKCPGGFISRLVARGFAALLIHPDAENIVRHDINFV